LLQKISKNFQNKLQNAGHQKPAKPAALSAAFPEIYANSLINFNAFTHRLIWASPEHGGNALPANLFQDDYVSNFFSPGIRPHPELRFGGDNFNKLNTNFLS